MKAIVFGVLIATAAGVEAQAQVTTNCTTLVPGSINCNSYDYGAASRQMNDGMANLGAALGNAARARRERKEAAETTAIRQACLKPDTPVRLAASAFHVCVAREAERLEASGASPQEIASIAGGACVGQREDLVRQADLCRLENSGPVFDEQGKQSAMRAVIERRVARASPPSEQTSPARP